MANPLSTSRRSELRAEAHALKPVVLIGDKGLTETVVKEIDRALLAHELIKVKAGSDDRDLRAGWMAQICERLAASEVQQIGKILVLYRLNPEKHVVKKADQPRPKRPPRTRPEPVAEPKKPRGRTSSGKKPSLWTKKPREAAAPTGTSRRRSPAPSPRPASGPRRRPRSTSR